MSSSFGDFLLGAGCRTMNGPDSSGLAGHVADYLALRRPLGFKLERAGLLLGH
jgi:hypothetical protein